MRKLLPLVAAILLATSTTFAQTGTGTATGSLQLTVQAEAKLAITSADPTPLTIPAGSNFSNFTGQTTLTYSIRTTKTGGTGTVTFKISSDFSPSGGPGVAADLTYGCGSWPTGTGCTGSTNAIALGTAETVATFSADVHQSNATGNVGWTLLNDPAYATGPYSVSVTYTISAT